MGLLSDILGFGLTAAGSAQQAREEQKNEKRQIKARNRATHEAVTRDKKYQRRAADVFSQALHVPAGVPDTIANAGHSAAKDFVGSTPTAADVGSLLLGPNISPEAAAAERAALDRTLGNARDESRRLGALTGWSEGMGKFGQRLDRYGRRIGDISDIASRMLALTPLARDVAAANATKTASGTGPALSAAGVIVPRLINSAAAAFGGVPTGLGMY